MKHLFFDTETTGTPKNYNGRMDDLENWPRVIQLAWALFEDEKLIEDRVFLIKPDGWVIPKEKFWIDNGYSTERSEADGFPIIEALDAFIRAYNSADVLVAHNMNFDYNVLGSEMIRAGVRANKQLPRECTMKASTNYCQLPGKYGYKFPKLEELYYHLFKEGFEGAHDALNDVRACAKCYYELKKRKVM